MKPSNLGLCFNGMMNIVLSAKYANLNSRWLARVLCPSFDGFHKIWTSLVAFDRLLESLTSIVACLKSTHVGTGEHVTEVFILLAIGTLPGMIGVVVIIFDKLSSLGAEIEPVVNELRPIGGLFRLGTLRYHVKLVLSNMAPLLVTPVILGLKKFRMNISANFCTYSTNIMGGDSCVLIEYLHWHVPKLSDRSVCGKRRSHRYKGKFLSVLQRVVTK